MTPHTPLTDRESLIDALIALTLTIDLRFIPSDPWTVEGEAPTRQFQEDKRVWTSPVIDAVLGGVPVVVAWRIHGPYSQVASLVFQWGDGAYCCPLSITAHSWNALDWEHRGNWGQWLTAVEVEIQGGKVEVIHDA